MCSCASAGLEVAAIVDPGAMVEQLGDRCASNWSWLDAVAPVVGTTMMFTGSGAPAGSIGVIAAVFWALRLLLPGVIANGGWSRAAPADALLPPTASLDWQTRYSMAWAW